LMWSQRQNPFGVGLSSEENRVEAQTADRCDLPCCANPGRREGCGLDGPSN
jgi:hypothetical protein